MWHDSEGDDRRMTGATDPSSKVGNLQSSLGPAPTMLLAAQGLVSPPERPAEKGDVLGAIRRIGVLQIDSISVVARSPYLVLWSRLGSYEPRWLDELLAEGRLFEGWAHAACFVPIGDYGLYRRFVLEGGEKSRAWFSAHPEEGRRGAGGSAPGMPGGPGGSCWRVARNPAPGSPPTPRRSGACWSVSAREGRCAPRSLPGPTARPADGGNGSRRSGRSSTCSRPGRSGSRAATPTSPGAHTAPT